MARLVHRLAFERISRGHGGAPCLRLVRHFVGLLGTVNRGVKPA